jgi:hypothetical protein
VVQWGEGNRFSELARVEEVLEWGLSVQVACTAMKVAVELMCK